jgi:glycolate oxidase FAD binding subunit
LSAPRDQSDRLQEAVRNAHLEGRELLISGSGSKSFLSRDSIADGAALLSTIEHSGVVDYRPDELVVTVRAGTPLRELKSLLDQHQQMLPFDPPLFSGGGTIGGAVASGLSGPGRPWRGSVRDCLLGVQMLNGLGERLKFGGQVMKNVAGYDVSRLQAGAFGSLGVLLDVSVRLLPQPAAEQTCCFELGPAASLRKMREWARRPLPLSGVCFVDGVLRARISGAPAAVDAAARQLSGEVADDGGRFWQQLRDHTLPELKGPEMLRALVPAAAEEPIAGAILDWGGALRWWPAGASQSAIADLARAAGGSSALFGGDFARRATPAMAAALRSHHVGIKRAFDPGNILNPGLVELDAD